MKRFFYLLSMTLLAWIPLSAQNFSWAKQVAVRLDGLIYAKCSAVDGSGNLFTTGYFNNTVDFDPGAGVLTLTAQGLNDSFVCKYDAAGNLIWVKSIGGSAASALSFGLAIDASGNLLITGSFAGTVNFDPLSGNMASTLSSLAGSDAFLCKWDANGTFMWVKSIEGIANEISKVVVIDAASNIYINGTFNDATDFDPGPGTYTLNSNGLTDVFITKLDASGNFIWARSMGGNWYDFTADKMAVDFSGNVYTSGYFYNTADFDPGPGIFNLTSAGGSDVFISKLDASGNFAWAKRIGGTGSDQGFSIGLDAFNNVYTVGSFYGNVDFDPGTGVYNISCFSPGSTDGFVSKLNSSGNFLWAVNFGGPQGDCVFDIALDAAGNSYITGQFLDVVNFDPATGINNLTSAGDFDAFTCKLDIAGNYIWAKRFGGSGNDVCEGIVIAGTSIYSRGLFQYTSDFDPGPDVFNLTTTDLSTPFVHKMNVCNLVSKQITGSTLNLCPGLANTYIANEVEGASSYVWSFPNGWVGNSTTNTITVVAGTNSGSLTVVASNSCGVAVLQKLYLEINACTGVNEINTAPFYLLIYPNPSMGNFIVETEEELTLSIFDSQGKLIKEQKMSEGINHVTIPCQSKGIYFLNLVSGSKAYRTKLSVEL